MTTKVRKNKHILSVYGSVSLEKCKCSICGDVSIVQDGKTTCCDAPVSGTPEKYQRETAGAYHRKRPSKPAQALILKDQENRCFYCKVEFGSIRYRNKTAVTIRIEWDHMLPYAYSQNNHDNNFVAACHVCNGIKSDKVFSDVQEAVEYLAAKRMDKGYDF